MMRSHNIIIKFYSDFLENCILIDIPLDTIQFVK